MINGSQNVGPSSAFWIGAGALLTWGLMLARAYYAGFPFHPIGLLICLTSTINGVWFSVFLGWLCKGLITKFGGIDSYRKMVRVLRYRIAPRYRHPIPLQDAQRALRLVRLLRAQNSKWDIAPNRIGVWGFSAGGHLASTLATHFDKGDANSSDAVERASCRPDFQILSYPVITLKPPHAHEGSREALLGQNPDAVLLESLCNETQVTPQTPPAFLFHTADDGAVPVENSLLYFAALRNCGVSAELRVYEKGAHGVGLAQDEARLREWPDALASWLQQPA